MADADANANANASAKRTPAEISQLPIDHRAGFLLTFIDGEQTIDQILDGCAMPLREALALIQSLATLGVSALSQRPLRR